MWAIRNAGMMNRLKLLTHWGRVTCICISNYAVIDSNNGLSPGQWQAIIWANAGILLIVPLETNFIEILIKIHIFPFKKMQFKILSAKFQPCCHGLNESMYLNVVIVVNQGGVQFNVVLCGLQTSLLSHPGIPGVTLCFCTGSYAAAGRRFLFSQLLLNNFLDFFHFWYDCWARTVDYLIRFWSIFVVTLTLIFQGKIWNLQYFSQKWSDSQETKSKHAIEL